MPNLVVSENGSTIIETERLKMRRHRLDDFPASAAIWADPVVTRYIGGRPLSGEESWARLLRHAGHWSLMGFGYWAIEEKTTGNLVGEVGFVDYKRDLEPSLDGVPELGWIFSSRVHGRGYATEAARAALAWGQAHFTSKRTVCLIHPENLASIRVADKCGYREYGRSPYKGHTVILFARESS